MTIRCMAGLLAAAMMTLQLPACHFSGSVETMLSPPRLTQEQEQIYQALQNTVGAQISLKYPKSGERLSAFTVVDLDDDGSDEALVFYQTLHGGADENPLRVCLLAQEEGKWRAISDYPTAGAEVERIDVQKLGNHPRTNVIISYSLVDGADHAATVYHYEAGQLMSSLSLHYSTMALRDLDGDDSMELFVTTAAQAPQLASVMVYALEADGSYMQSTLELPESITDVTRLAYGILPMNRPEEHTPAIYMDCVTGATTTQTVVLHYGERILSLLYQDAADRFPNTTRPSGCQSMDIDRDGEIEIPVNSVFYGYSNAADGSPLSMTNWYVCRNGLLIREYASYYSVSNKYIFVIPERWEQKVTAIMEDEQLVFYELDRTRQEADGTPVLLHPLLRLAVEKDAISADGLQAEGYQLLRQHGGSYYLGAIPASDSKLQLTSSELMFAMRVLE